MVEPSIAIMNFGKLKEFTRSILSLEDSKYSFSF
jgi:hypothetical protein